jgi:hypothetical protein
VISSALLDKPRGRGRFDLGAEQLQSLSGFLQCEQLSPHLEPQNVGRLVESEIGDEQVRFSANQHLRERAVPLLEHPFQPARRVDDERHNQSVSRRPANAVVRSARDS